MDNLKQLCREMAADQRILTFSDLARAAVDGAIIGQKVNNPLVGAMLGISLKAGQRAVSITEALLTDLSDVTEKSGVAPKLTRG